MKDIKALNVVQGSPTEHTITPSSSPSSSTHGSSLSLQNRIGLGVGIGVGVPGTLAAIAGVYFIWKRQDVPHIIVWARDGRS